MNPIFPKGNLDGWNIAITKYLPEAINTIYKTLDPVISAALLELTGSTSDFEKSEGFISLEYDEAKLPTAVNVALCYVVPSFKVEDVSEEAITHDKAFLLAYLQQIQATVKVSKLTLDTKEGKVSVSASVKVGYHS